MEFTITENQAKRSIDLALNIWEYFLKENEIEKTFEKIIVNGTLEFDDNYRNDIVLEDVEIIYAGEDEYDIPIFEFTIDGKERTKNLFDLCVWLSYGGDIDLGYE